MPTFGLKLEMNVLHYYGPETLQKILVQTFKIK